VTEQEIKKSIEKLVDDIMKPEAAAPATKTEEVIKAMPTKLAVNGGKDEIKSGSPHQEEQQASEAKKAKKEDDEDEDDKDDEKEKKDKMKKSDETPKTEEVAKAEDCDDDADEDKEEKKEKKDKKKMKKSIEELSAHLDEDEIELIKAWREESEKEETVAKADPAVEEKKDHKEEDLAKTLSKVMEDSIAPLKKALEEKDELIKSLTDKVEKMASQPAYDRRSIANLEPLEKSGDSQYQELTKSQVAAKMLDLQLAGKGVTSHNIAEFEATGNISDKVVRDMLFNELKLK